MKTKNKKRKSPLDLNELFPNYFNKNIFRAVIILMILLYCFTLYTNDWEYKFTYAYCPPENIDGCLVPTGNSSLEFGVLTPELTYLAPDTYLGTPPNDHANKFNNRCFMLILLGFVLNHFFYYFKTGKSKPEVNQKRLKELKKVFSERSKE